MGCGCISQNKAGYSKNGPKEFLPDNFPDGEFVRSLSAEELEDKDRLLEYYHRLNEGQFEVTESFRDLVRRKGVPQRYRWLAWKALSGWTVLYKPGAYERIKQSEPDPRVIDAVEKDLDRTFPRMDEFDEEKKRQLAYVGRSYAALFPQVGYCQGMNFIAGFLLLTAGASHEDAFYMFVRIMTKYRASLLFCEGLPLLKLLTFQFRALLEHFFPEVHSHFINQNITPELYFTKWILTIFTQPLCIASAARVWDLIVCDGLETLLLVALGTIKVLKPRLLKEATEGVIELLSLHQELSPPTGGAIVKASLELKLPSGTLSFSALRSAWAIEEYADAAELEKGELELCATCPEPLELPLPQLPLPLPEPATPTPSPLAASPKADALPLALGAESPCRTTSACQSAGLALSPDSKAEAEAMVEQPLEAAAGLASHHASEAPGLEPEVEVQVETTPDGSSGSKAPTPEPLESQQKTISREGDGSQPLAVEFAGDGSSSESSQHAVANEAKVDAVNSTTLSRRPAGGDLTSVTHGEAELEPPTSCSAQLALREPGLVTASSTSTYVSRMLLQAAASAEPQWPELQSGQQSVAPPAAVQATRPLLPMRVEAQPEEVAAEVGIADLSPATGIAELNPAMGTLPQQDEGGLSECSGNHSGTPLLATSSSSIVGSPSRGALWQQGVNSWSLHRTDEESALAAAAGSNTQTTALASSPRTNSIAGMSTGMPPDPYATGPHPVWSAGAAHFSSSGDRGKPGMNEFANSEAGESKHAHLGFVPLKIAPPAAPPPQPGWRDWSVPSEQSGRSCDITSRRPDFVVDAQAGSFAAGSMSPGRGVVSGGQVRDVASPAITRVSEAWGSPRLMSAEMTTSDATPRSREKDKYEKADKSEDVDKNEDAADAEALLV
mmetsp:Transcript_136661/g.240983  ORF Transcript_136661/g.240983 Transcript_136661/m.240983 type:complete len:898 (-) Transcript_136661:191-2884(-)